SHDNSQVLEMRFSLEARAKGLVAFRAYDDMRLQAREKMSWLSIRAHVRRIRARFAVSKRDVDPASLTHSR
ncbi:hypothetical protein, partial [Eggerthella sp.]|uniref:hypothetical protein n=1 Tax=Eggerthella sp. TaxID=1929886 RepID=UPI003AB3AE0F